MRLKKSRLIIAGLFVCCLLLRLHWDFPVTYFEATLSNKYGLSGFYLRLTSILIGSLTLFLFIKWLESLKVGEKFFWLVGSTFFIISPLLIQVSIFDLLADISLAIFLIGLILYGKKRKIYAVLTFFLIIFLQVSLIKIPIFTNLLPSGYLWSIDRRLAYDQVENSPFYTTRFNFNRFIHNKFVYPVNIFFRDIIMVFNFERISSPLQAESSDILRYEDPNQKGLPRIFFIEIPLIFLGILWTIKHRNRTLGFGLVVGLIFSALFFKSQNSLVFLAPGLIASESIAFLEILKYIRIKRIIKFALMFSWGGILFLSFFNYYDLLLSHQNVWMDEADYRHFQIWQFLGDKLPNYEKIYVTDRLGDPENYFHYYNKNAKSKFFPGSFKYLESDRKAGQLWIGLAGEFVGKYYGYTDVSEISDGKILKKFYGIRQADNFYGDELWIVEINFSKKQL